MAINLIVTNAGRAALINAQNNGTNAVQFAKCGISATNANYNAASTALQNELKRIDNISGSALSPDTINLAFADTSTDAYDLRAFAIYLADNTLFAIASQATPIYAKTNNTDGLLSVNIKFSDISTSQITFANYNLVNPPSTEITAGVIEIATQTETNTGTDDLRAITPKKLTAFWNNKSAWTVNNDGAGSGLDADLLDGQHGAYFLDLANATNTLPSARLSGTYNISISGNAASADNATNATNANKLGNILAANHWHSANDGAGSGLDADLLDGQHGAFYSDIPARLGYTPPQQGGGIGQLGNKVYIGWSGSRLKAQVDATDLGHIVFDAQISDAWRASNDGAGSGLDADLFDGLDSSAFAKLSGANFTGNVGLYGNLDVDGGDVNIKRTTNYWGYVTRPNVAGYKNLQFATQGGGSLDNLELNSLNLTTRSNIIWHAGNDGAGSGLDADLLDGQHGAYYAPINNPNFSGVLSAANYKLSKCYDNASGNEYYLGTNSWPGSGPAFTGVSSAIGILSINGAGSQLVTLGSASGQMSLQVDGSIFAGDGIIYNPRGIYGYHGGYIIAANDIVAGNDIIAKNNFFAGNNTVWHAGNDGAGSGSDADLLDGQHGAYYWSDGRASKSLATNGYRILPDGMIEQWGEATLTGDINQVVSFPIAFPNACLQAVGCQGGDFAVNTDAGAGVQSFTNSTITLRNGSWMTTKIRYFAIGN